MPAHRTSQDRDRYGHLKEILEERKRKIHSEIQEKMRDVRVLGREQEQAQTQREVNKDMQDDLEFAITQMKSETLGKIDEALKRLDEGTFGYCNECGEPISERRLMALPFALRCKDCERAREEEELQGKKKIPGARSNF